ncbi:MAG: glycosyltransferase family 2 protein [Syntrophales bacterium]|jgi:glycosyltransferase involved in cell wall biosynthesis
MNQPLCIEVSVVIPVFNRWQALSGCLESLFAQVNPPSYEVIVIDDGSDYKPPEKLIEQARAHQVVWRRQEGLGVSEARNSGIRYSRGSIILFTDSDCVLDADCLRAFQATVSEQRSSDAFQLRICGRADDLVGKTEELRQSTIQHCLLLPDGKIRWLNTAGFAIRRNSLSSRGKLFDERALRSQDTLLLATLIEENNLPVFVPHAIVYHCPDLSVLQYIWKGMWSAYREGRTYSIIRAMGIKVRSSYSRRFFIFYMMWKKSSEKSIGRQAFLVALTRFFFGVVGSWLYQFRRMALIRKT